LRNKTFVEKENSNGMLNGNPFFQLQVLLKTASGIWECVIFRQKYDSKIILKTKE
jgi:hypothetical protein